MSQQLFKVYLQSIQHTFKDLPKGNFYWRFHKRDINKIVTTPCPVDSPTKETEIQLFKELRAQIGVREDFVCPQCPHHAKCQKAFQQTDGGNMQTLQLPQLSKFLETINKMIKKAFGYLVQQKFHLFLKLHYSNSHINKVSYDVNKYQKIIYTRVLDTFHSILIDFQLNNNKLNEQFLSDISQVSENESIHQQESNKRPDKYTKKVDFIGDQNTQPKKEGRRNETEEFDNDNKPQSRRQNYNENSEGRYEKFNRYDKGDRYNNKFDRSDQFNRRDRFDKYDNQQKSDRQFDQNKYNDSGRYDKYAHKQDNYERYDNKDRYNRNERPQKYDREANGNQYRENRSFDKYEDRGQKYDRSDRSERRDKFDRNDRSERGFKGDRFDRRNTDYNEESKETSRNYKGRNNDFQDNNEKSHYENDKYQKNYKQTKVKEEDDFNSFVKQREQYLKDKEENFEGDKKQNYHKKENRSVQQNDQSNISDMNEEESSLGRKVKRSMKFKIQ